MARETRPDEQPVRRSVVPDAARRTPWFAAAWTGLGAAIVGATAAIIAVAACWLPVSGDDGRTNSAIRAGLLTFLASVHGGVTVDGVSGAWLPLGLIGIVGLTAWRAGSGLADAVSDERDPVRLALIGLAQAVAFAVGCLVAVPFATLGTSRAPFLGVGLGALITFAATGGTAFVRSCTLREWCAARVPGWMVTVLRAAAAGVAVYLAAGALLVAGSLVLHHDVAETLSRQVGGGIGGVPILLLGILAAPNAVIAGASYLAGPGFAVGTGSTVRLFAAPHGTLPAFPVLAAIPSGSHAGPVVWGLAALTPLIAGLVVARLAARVDGWWRRLGIAATAALVAGLIMLVLGWQGGGSLGDGRLRTVGPSPWQFGGAIAAALLAVAALGLGFAAAWQWIRSARSEDDDADDEADDEADDDADADDADDEADDDDADDADDADDEPFFRRALFALSPAKATEDADDSEDTELAEDTEVTEDADTDAPDDDSLAG